MLHKPVALCILDGWGLSPHQKGNAIALAHTPNYDRLLEACPNAQLTTHGESVGLPPGSIGNSEVGHLHIGSGRVNLMPILQINQAIKTGQLAELTVVNRMAQCAQSQNKSVHIVGIVSNIGVHGLGKHIIATANAFAKQGVKVYIHAITDGRDEPPGHAEKQIDSIAVNLPKGASIATVSGRYFLMDRDHRWDRIKKGFNTLVYGKGIRAKSAQEAVQMATRRNETDEFIQPTVVESYSGFNEGDYVFFTNFRADRMRQLTAAIAQPGFACFEINSKPQLGGVLSMVDYFTPPKQWLPCVFSKKTITNTLGEWVAQHGLTQMRIAETEKFPHVTFFLNGGKEKREVGEQRAMPASPKVATYDLAPEMSSVEVTNSFIKAVHEGLGLIIVNVANPDMVGHTGDLKATIKACEATDRALGRMVDCIKEGNGAMLVIADHGNCEQMIDPVSGGVHTAHTTNPVPVLLVGKNDNTTIQSGSLIDVAPTLLELLGISKPSEMTGKSLIKH